MPSVLETIRAARLPKFVETTTLPMIGQQGLRDVIANGEYRTKEGPVSYLMSGNFAPSVARVAAVFCKELVLAKEKAIYLPASELQRISSYAHQHPDAFEMMTELYKFYWIIPDLQERIWYSSDATRSFVYQMVKNHYYRGGGVVICGDGTKRFGDYLFDQFVEALPVLTVR